MSDEKRAYFYSYDGRIWYWGRFTVEDHQALLLQGVRFLVDNKLNRSRIK